MIACQSNCVKTSSHFTSGLIKSQTASKENRAVLEQLFTHNTPMPII